jgi:hypothetical protein
MIVNMLINKIRVRILFENKIYLIINNVFIKIFNHLIMVDV